MQSLEAQPEISVNVKIQNPNVKFEILFIRASELNNLFVIVIFSLYSQGSVVKKIERENVM